MDGEVAGGVPAPGIRFLERDLLVGVADEHLDRAVDDGVGRTDVPLDGPVVGPHGGENRAQHLLVVQQPGVGAAQLADLGHQTCVVPQVDVFGTPLGGSTAPGRDQHGGRQPFPPHAHRHLEGHRGAHAVAEERRPRFTEELGSQRLEDPVGQLADVGHRGLPAPVLAPGVLDRQDLDVGPQGTGHRVEEGRRPAGVRKAHDPRLGRRRRVIEPDPARAVGGGSRHG